MRFALTKQEALKKPVTRSRVSKPHEVQEFLLTQLGTSLLPSLEVMLPQESPYVDGYVSMILKDVYI